MGQRPDLQTLLVALMAEVAPTGAVYFQPPDVTQMVYPCIRYERSDIVPGFADNIPYRLRKQYQLTVIDTDPDSLIPDQVATLESCKFERHFVVDNRNHDVFMLYY